jgi:hypothetical protein
MWASLFEIRSGASEGLGNPATSAFTNFANRFGQRTMHGTRVLESYSQRLLRGMPAP